MLGEDPGARQGIKEVLGTCLDLDKEVLLGEDLLVAKQEELVLGMAARVDHGEDQVARQEALGETQNLQVDHGEAPAHLVEHLVDHGEVPDLLVGHGDLQEDKEVLTVAGLGEDLAHLIGRKLRANNFHKLKLKIELN